MLHEGFRGFLLPQVDGLSAHVHGGESVFSVAAYGDFGLCQCFGVGAGVEYECASALGVHHGAVGDAVVVSAEYDVESRHAACDGLCHALAEGSVAFGIPHSGMEKPYHHVGFVAQPWHIAVGNVLDGLEFHALPQVLRHPLRYAGGDHSEHCHAYAVAFDDGIGQEVGAAVVAAYGVCAEHGHPALPCPPVVDVVSGLDVVVSDGDGVVAHMVEHVGAEVCGGGVDEVVVVCRGLSLQDVAVVEQDDAVVAACQAQ